MSGISESKPEVVEDTPKGSRGRGKKRKGGGGRGGKKKEEEVESDEESEMDVSEEDDGKEDVRYSDFKLFYSCRRIRFLEYLYLGRELLRDNYKTLRSKYSPLKKIFDASVPLHYLLNS